jgi:hypothetical protein
MLDMQFVLAVVDHDARLVRSNAVFNCGGDLRPQLCSFFDDLVSVLCRCGLAVEKTAGCAVIDAKFSFKAVTESFLAG